MTSSASDGLMSKKADCACSKGESTPKVDPAAKMKADLADMTESFRKAKGHWNSSGSVFSERVDGWLVKHGEQTAGFVGVTALTFIPVVGKVIGATAATVAVVSVQSSDDFGGMLDVAGGVLLARAPLPRGAKAVAGEAAVGEAAVGKAAVVAAEGGSARLALPAARTPTPRLPGRTADPVGGFEVGEFISTPSGLMPVPRGGSWSVRPNGVDIHSYYPNGSNAYRINPSGHGNNPVPHMHLHLPGAGPGPRAPMQGPSLDMNGNVVPFNSSGAHWPL